MKIKATSINNLTDARYFAAWNVEWLGFSLELGHSNYTSPQDVKEIKDWLVGPKIVGEFGMTHSLAEIQASVELLHLDAVQLGMYTADEIALQLNGTSIFKEWVLEDLSGLDLFGQKCQTLANAVDYFCLDFEKNGIDWAMLKQNAAALQQLQELCQEYAILISIHCPPSELQDFLDQVQPYGISLQGGEEEKVGVKSFDDLDEIFEQLEELDLIGF